MTVLQSAPKQGRHAADVKAAEGLPSPAVMLLAAATPDPEQGSIASGAARAGQHCKALTHYIESKQVLPLGWIRSL